MTSGPGVASIVDCENLATISRATCGWKHDHLALDDAREYLRDVHGPAIARRSGIYEYRHFWLDEVRTDLFAPVAGIRQDCEPGAKLMWISDVRYRDEQSLARFSASPDPGHRRLILHDIDIVIQASTTYRSTGPDTITLADTTGVAAPQGPVRFPSYQVLFRQRGDAQAAFRHVVREMAARWAATPGVRRVRVSLFDEPDMEAERAAGYPIKTHPPAQQYQAWIDLSVETDVVAASLMTQTDGIALAAHIRTMHAYAVRHLYTPVYGGRPTLVGLRGYPAYRLIEALDAGNQADPGLLAWMYGDAAAPGHSP